MQCFQARLHDIRTTEIYLLGVWNRSDAIVSPVDKMDIFGPDHSNG